MHQTRPDSIWAAGSVSAAGARVAPPIGGAVPFASDWTVAGPAASIYTITLGSPIEATERIVEVTVRDVLDSIAVHIAAGETSTTILIATGQASTGMAADAAFDFVVHRLAG